MKNPREVYRLIHKPTGKIYVGSSRDPWLRIYNHVSALKRGEHPNEAMQKDFNQYGGEYDVAILDTIRCREDNNKEFLWMDALRTREAPFGYNVNDHSKGSDIYNFKCYPVPMSGPIYDPRKKKIDTSTVGGRIAARRKEIGMTQQELAVLVGLKSKQAISKIEKSVNGIGVVTLDNIAKALRASPAELAGWE